MKNNFFTLPETQQIMVLEQTAIKHNLPKQAIEKDLVDTCEEKSIF
jgi:hypothetical protein